MTKKRVFTAINLPRDIKEELVSCQKKWRDLPVRWTPFDNLHITLVFIGSVEEKQSKQIEKVTERVADSCSPFSVELYNITLGPPNSPPRMLWVNCRSGDRQKEPPTHPNDVEGEHKEEMVELHEKLEDSLARVKNTGLDEKESRTYKPHITLGRINEKEWRQMGQQPTINEELSLKVPVDSIEVMESDLKSSGAEYSIVESYEL